MLKNFDNKRKKQLLVILGILAVVLYALVSSGTYSVTLKYWSDYDLSINMPRPNSEFNVETSNMSYTIFLDIRFWILSETSIDLQFTEFNIYDKIDETVVYEGVLKQTDTYTDPDTQKEYTQWAYQERLDMGVGNYKCIFTLSLISAEDYKSSDEDIWFFKVTSSSEDKIGDSSPSNIYGFELFSLLLAIPIIYTIKKRKDE